MVIDTCQALLSGGDPDASADAAAVRAGRERGPAGAPGAGADTSRTNVDPDFVPNNPLMRNIPVMDPVAQAWAIQQREEFEHSWLTEHQRRTGAEAGWLLRTSTRPTFSLLLLRASVCLFPHKLRHVLISVLCLLSMTLLRGGGRC